MRVLGGMEAPLNLARPENLKPFAHFARHKEGRPLWSRHDSGPEPYMHCGCHPDIVERIWDQIGPALGIDCRCLIYHIPALVHPVSGLLLAIGNGTQYCLYLPGKPGQEALAAGAKLETVWSGGSRTNTVESLGEGWVFGSWHAREPEWCRRVSLDEIALRDPDQSRLPPSNPLP